MESGGEERLKAEPEGEWMAESAGEKVEQQANVEIPASEWLHDLPFVSPMV